MSGYRKTESKTVFDLLSLFIQICVYVYTYTSAGEVRLSEPGLRATATPKFLDCNS